jgi:glutamate--cysteine ligase catalytic subunit
MEVQITDFENAAFSIFIVLVTRIIISYKLVLYLPMSKVDENMRVAHYRNASQNNKFWFRTDLRANDSGSGEGKYEQLSVNEIINGGPTFVGLIPLIRRYLASMMIDLNDLCQLENYLNLVSRRASGELVTSATWIRKFIRGHPSYKFDSVITDEINYDLVEAISKLTRGEDWTTLGKELFGTKPFK